MFTGIVEEMGTLRAVDGYRLDVQASVTLEGLRVGDSIAVNGACLTVTRLESDAFSVEVTPETLRRTNLGHLSPGDPVNLERSLAWGGRLGGHLVQGHVDGTGEVVELAPQGNAHIMRFRAPPEVMRYVVPKGYIAIDGTSLTVVEVKPDTFTVSVIPATYRETVLGARRPGSVVNLEVDILAKYVEWLLGGERDDSRPFAAGSQEA